MILFEFQYYKLFKINLFILRLYLYVGIISLCWDYIFMLGLYIHIPFCTHKCPFCDFAAFQGLAKLEDKYIDVLIKEIDFKVKQNQVVNSIFFGGGTPSLTSIENLAKVFQVLKTKFSFAPDIEISLESTPHSLDLAKTKELINLGFNRLSIGVQTFNDSELIAINRDHTSLQAEQGIEIAHLAGFKNINIDLMYGLPSQTYESFQTSFFKLMNLSKQYPYLTHFSLYGLTLEENSPFYKLHSKNSPLYPSDEISVNMYIFANKIASQFGYDRYELSNFAKPNYQSTHNLNYWQLGEFYGFGISSYQYLNNYRQSNWKSISKYLANYETCETVEYIDPKTKLKELIMLGLRLKEGINLQEFSDKFNYNFAINHAKTIAELEENGYCLGMRSERCQVIISP